MKNFVLFFEEKEGSTAVVQTLDSLESISLVRRETSSGLGGWEPFEWFNCGSLGRSRFRECLRLIFSERPLNLAHLNELYLSTARAPLRSFGCNGSVGFKMRIVPPWDLPNLRADSAYRSNRAVDFVCRSIRRIERNSFRSLMADLLGELDVVVFVMVRQNIFRWAISKYHGDGSGKPGHLQFRMAAGDVPRSSLPRIEIEPKRFERILAKCVELHRIKRWWYDAMKDAGVTVHPLRYEEFSDDRVNFFAKTVGCLGTSVSPQDLSASVSAGTRLARVHGTDISEYVINHREISEKYGDRFIRW
jgi:hypothetical protein